MAGLYNQAGVPSDAIDAMIARLGGRQIDHRCVDDDFVLAGSVSPLSIGGRHVVADVRLVDREALCAKLDVSASQSDAELILRAYLKFKDECVQHLNGDFAFCIIDRGRLFCARDHLGIKPFYFAAGNQRFVFASEGRPVADQIGLRVNQQRIADYLVYPMEHVDTSSTFYLDVKRLPPATIMVVHNGELKQRRYWQPSSAMHGEYSDREAVDQFRHLLSESIRQRQQEADGRFALSLSGGLDSSLIAAIASQSERVVTFSTVVNDVDCEESQQVRELQAALPVEATSVSLWDLEALDQTLFSHISNVGEPFDDNMLQMMLINEVAAAAGFRFLADGVEGDLTYSMSARYSTQLIQEGQILSGLKETLGQLVHSYGAPHSGLSLAVSALRRSVPSQITKRLKKNPDGSSLIGDLIDPAFAADMRVLERRRDMTHSENSLADHVLYRALHPAIVVALERYDRVAAQSGMTTVHPLLDVRLIEFGLSLPWHLRRRNGWDKYIIRLAGAGIVPESVRWETGKPENAWQFNAAFYARHRDRIRESVAGSRTLLGPYIVPSLLDDPDDEALWRLFILREWLESQHSG